MMAALTVKELRAKARRFRQMASSDGDMNLLEALLLVAGDFDREADIAEARSRSTEIRAESQSRPQIRDAGRP